MLSAERALTQQEEIALHELQIRQMEIPSGQQIVREGDRPNHCAMLVDGFMFASKMTDDGQRQIVAIFVPGDIPDLHSLHLKVMDITITALGPCRIGSVSHEAIKRLVLAHPSVGFSLWRTTLIDAAISREWV